MPERILLEAEIVPNAVRYQVLAALAVMSLSIFMIPAIPIVLPIVHWYWTRQYRHMRVVLTHRDLEVRRGVLVREQKTIPLEKITDLAVFQGPIMRRMGLKGITVETAGQSSGPAALVKIVGIARTDEFRDMVLRQRDRIAEREPLATTPPAASPASPGEEPALVDLLTDIRDSLRRIEAALRERTQPR
jgi:putative membrane protein